MLTLTTPRAQGPSGATPLDHTSILETVQQRWGLPSLTARDAAAGATGDDYASYIRSNAVMEEQRLHGFHGH
ncbi:MAG: hypothetical protein ACM3ML_35030 [Micromonosporaceae bacterium]